MQYVICCTKHWKILCKGVMWVDIMDSFCTPLHSWFNDLHTIYTIPLKWSISQRKYDEWCWQKKGELMLSSVLDKFLAREISTFLLSTAIITPISQMKLIEPVQCVQILWRECFPNLGRFADRKTWIIHSLPKSWWSGLCCKYFQVRQKTRQTIPTTCKKPQIAASFGFNLE